MSAQDTETEKKIAQLEGTDAAVLFPGFEAALKSVLKVLLHPGEHVLSSSAISDATMKVLTSDQSIETTFIAPNEPRRWKEELQKGRTRVMFVQNPPTGYDQVIDMRPMHLLAESRGVILILDLSLAPPDDHRLLEHEADILVHSCARYEGKLGNISCGVVAGAAPLIEEIRSKIKT